MKAAENWGTYVTVHAYTPQGGAARHRGRRARASSTGTCIDEPTAQLMADKGVWISLQPLPAGRGHDPVPRRLERACQAGSR
ncbi:MAG: hypothetical protein MZW92_23085 [Comamonadaceae bacterium]|nr:hypothetical protein [Comamonadaceae bacterium]